jgi:hypothetical protein
MLFNGQASEAWLPQAFAGGNYQSFARFEDEALVVDVPAGHAWGTTGLYSAQPLVPMPLPSADTVQRLRFRLDPEVTNGAIFALVPEGRAGGEEWGVHDIRIGFFAPDGGKAELVMWMRREEQGRYTVTDRSILSDLVLDLRPDGLAVLADAAGHVLLQGVMPDFTPGSAWHIYAEGSAPAPDHPVHFRLDSIRLENPEWAAPDPAAPLEAKQTVTLFDGQVIHPRYMRFNAHGGDFARHARMEDGALVVDVPEGQGWGKVGLASTDATVWLDRFQNDARVTLSFEFDKPRTTGFVVALSEFYGLNERPEPAAVLPSLASGQGWRHPRRPGPRQ